MTDITWTDERVGRLIRLWAKGDSCAQIGGQMGITRNAVIGKASRLGLPPRLRSHSTTRRRPTEKRAYARKYPPVRFCLPELTIAPVPAVALLVTRPCQLLELTDDTCRYPFGDPGQPDFYFCGAEPLNGSPYCKHHHKLTHYQKSVESRRVMPSRIVRSWQAA